MKKVFFLVCIVVLSLFSFGCTKTIELTDEENYLIAEYAAELLLKYDRNSESKYYDGLEEVKISEEQNTEEAVTTADAATEDIASETEAKPEDVRKNDTQSVTNVTADEDKSFDIAAFAGENNVSIQYEDYMLVDEYPSYGQDGVYIDIDAPSGYKLLVLKFVVKNNTNEQQAVDMYSKALEYSIILNNSKSTKQMLTILIDDLYTYQASIEADAQEEVVLLFQISDSVAQSIEDIKLKVSSGDDSRVIQLY